MTETSPEGGDKPLAYLLVGDIIGRPGRRRLRQELEAIQETAPVDMIVVNVENAAGGFGLTPEVANEFRAMGVTVMTSGNHIYDKKEIVPYLDSDRDILRPANYPEGAPGKGVAFVTVRGVEVAVINLQGRVLMPWVACPFAWVDNNLAAIRRRTPHIIIDFHAETTAETNALGWYVNGRVTVVFGTHTHIATADARILPGEATGYMTDVGMTGPYDSVIGMDPRRSIARMRNMFPRHLTVASGRTIFSALRLEVDRESGRCLSLNHIYRCE